MKVEDSVTDALQEALSQDEGGMVTGWTLVVDYIDGEGEESTGFFSSDNMTANRELGMLQSGVIRVTEVLRDWFRDET